MKGLNLLLVAALMIGSTIPAANAAPDNLRKSSAVGGIGDRARTGGKVDVPVVRPVRKYFYENDPFYGKYYRTHQYRMKHYDGDGNVD